MRGSESKTALASGGCGHFRRRRASVAAAVFVLFAGCGHEAGRLSRPPRGLPKVRVAKDGREFVTSRGQPFVPWGVTYYRPGTGWAPQIWKRFDPEATRADFARMKSAGVNCVRVFLTYGSFYSLPGVLQPEGLAKFDEFLALAEQAGIYVHPTGPDHWEGPPSWDATIGSDEALDKRYGAATNVEDYAEKAQLMAYEGERAMFEAFGRNKYDSTGVIQWMLNNAWPSMIWHLYDYYLRPAGGYFGAKKACEPLHIQYSYDDHSVVVVNGYYRAFHGLKATAKIYNLDLTEKDSQQTTVDAAPDSSRRVFTLPEPDGLSSTYFVKLTLTDAGGKSVSSNFYWLSTQPDALGQPKEGSDWYYTPAKQFANFTALNTLPKAFVKISANSSRKNGEETTRVSIDNPGKSLAFFVHLKVILNQDDKEILPVIWQDNYFPLMPGEKREITAHYSAAALRGGSPMVQVDGWNVIPRTVPAR